MLDQRTRAAASWNILELRSLRRRGRRIWILISIYVSGRVLHLIMSMTREVHKNLSMKIQPSKVLYPSLRATMLLYWHMVKQERVKLTQWRALNTISVIHKEELFLDQWKKFSSSFKCNQARIQLSWSVLVICRFTTRLSQISWRLRGLLSKSEKTRRKVFSSKGLASGQWDLPMKSMPWCRRVPSAEQLPPPRWTISPLGPMLSSLLLWSRWLFSVEEINMKAKMDPSKSKSESLIWSIWREVRELE